MKEYLTSLLYVCIAAAVARAVALEGALKKYVEIICSVCVIAAVVSPAVFALVDEGGFESIFGGGEQWQTESYEEIFKEYLQSGSIGVSEQLLSEELCNYFKADAGDIEVRLTCNSDGNTVDVVGAVAVLRGEAIATDPQRIKDYVAQRLGVECEIIYESGG